MSLLLWLDMMGVRRLKVGIELRIYLWLVGWYLAWQLLRAYWQCGFDMEKGHAVSLRCSRYVIIVFHFGETGLQIKILNLYGESGPGKKEGEIDH